MDTLTLESEKVPTPTHVAVKPVCGACVHYQPHRDIQTGRVHPSKPGRCGWEMPEFEWPIAYICRAWGRDQLPSFNPSYVYRDTNAAACKCFKQ